MNRTATYEPRRHRASTHDIETWLGNSLATILAGVAVASGVVGMLVAFGYTNVDPVNEFNYGIIWMIGGLILGICANVFRREHHIKEFDETLMAGEYRSTPTPRSSRDVDERTYEETSRR